MALPAVGSGVLCTGVCFRMRSGGILGVSRCGIMQQRILTGAVVGPSFCFRAEKRYKARKSYETNERGTCWIFIIIEALRTRWRSCVIES